MKPEDNSLDQAYAGSAYDSSLESPMAAYSPVDAAAQHRAPAFRFNKLAFSIAAAILGLLLLAGVGSVMLVGFHNGNKSSQTGTAVNSYAAGSLSLQRVKTASQLQVGQADHLSVNGQLRVANTLVLEPTAVPSTPTAGQIYYDKTTNQPYYYNGSSFVSLAPVAVPQHVTALGGAAGIISLGSGLQISGNQLSVASSLLQAAANAGANSNSNIDPPRVDSLQGLTGNVTLTAGNGISISGTTISSNGVNNLSSGSTNLTISHDASGNYTITDSASGAGGQVNLGPVTVQTDASNNSSIHINKTGSGNLLELASNGLNTFVVNQNGQITSGTINYSQVQGAPATTVTSIAGVSGAIGLGSGLGISGSTLFNTGVVSISGTPNQVIASASSGSLTLSLPQDIATTSTPTFQGETLDGALTVNSGGVSISAGGLTVSGGGASLTGATSINGSLTVTGTNTLTTGTGTVTFGSLGAGLLQANAFGVLSSSAVDRNSSTLFSNTLGVANGGTGVASFTANGILYGNGAGALQATSSAANSVLATNGAGTPSLVQTLPATVQGNITTTGILTTGSIASGFGTIATGNNITTTAALQGTTLQVAGGSFSVNGSGDIATSGVAAIQGAGGLSLGAAGTTAGKLVFASANNTHFTTLQGLAPAGQDQTITIPASSATTDTVCLLTLANCVGSGGGITGSGGTQNYLTKFTNAGATQIGNSLVFDNGTSVGIGTNTPGASYKLDVSGNLNASGNASIGGSASVASGLTIAAGGLSVSAGGASITGNSTVNGSLVTGNSLTVTSGGLNVTGNSVISGTLGSLTGLTSAGTITFSGLSSAGIVHNNASGVLTTGAVALGTDTTGNYVASIGSLTGLTTSGNTGSGSTPTLSVVYGSTASSAVQGNTQLTVAAGTGLSGGAAITLGTGGTATLSVQYGSSSGTAVQGNTTLVCASGSGNLAGGGNTITLGSGGSCNNISITNSPTFSGTLSVQGAGGVAIGVAGTTAGLVNFANASNTNLGALQSAVLGQATSFILPDPGASSATICLSTGNCAGSGSGITGSGTSGKLAKFSSSGSIADSTLSESGSTVTASGNLVIQGSNSLSLGTSAANDGSIKFFNAAGTRTVSLQAPATDPASNLVFKLPNAYGSNGNCLTSDGGGGLSFTSCTGGAGGGVTSLDSQTGVLTLANSSSSSGTITIDNASTTQKGIAQFNATNFTASSGTINTVQDIASTSSPTFAGLTLSTALTVANGGTGASTLTTNGILYGNGSGAIQATGAAANSILATNGSNVPGLTQTLPAAVQANITTTGALTSGSIASGFGAISTANNITTTAAVQGGTLSVAGGTFAVNASGAITAVTGITSSGGYTQSGTGANTFTGATTIQNSLAVQGANVTVGAAGQQGSLVLNSGAGAGNKTGTLQVINNLAQNTVFTLPDPGVATATICLSTGNCAGSGSGVTTAGGTVNKFAIFTGSQAVGDSILSQNVGATAVTVSGDLSVTGTVSGNGSGLTNVDAATLGGQGGSYYTNASNISTGTLNDSRLSTNVTLQGNTFNGASQLVRLTGTGALPVLNGANLTNLNASNVASGTLSDSRLSTNVALLNANQSFSGNNTFTGNVAQTGTGTLSTGTGAVSLNGATSVSGSNTFTVGTGATSLGGTLAVAGASTFTGLVNANGGIVTGNASINAGTGTITSGAINGQTISSAANFTGSLTVQGGNLTLGTPGSTAGSLALANAVSSRQVILQGLNPSGTGNATIRLPSIAGGNTDTICLVTLANCSGANGGAGNTNYIFNQTTQQVGSNFNIDGTGKAATLNATSALQLNGININTAGTLNNVAYLNQANNFSAANTFSAAGTALTVNNNATISGTGTIGTLGVTNSATIGTGLTVTSGGATITAGGLTVSAGGASITGATSIAGNTSVTGTNTFTVGTGATNLGGALAVTGTSTLTGLLTANGGITAVGNINTTGQFQVGGTQISSANLSNDSNLAKLNATQTFTGNNTFTGNVAQTGTGTFSTGTGGVTLNGAVAISGTNTLTVGTGASVFGGTVGVTGLATLSGGATVSGATTITGTANINTTGTANTSIGNGTGNFSLASSGLNVSVAGALSGISTLSASGAISAATSGNTINGLVVNSGALSGITGYVQASGNFAQSGTGTFSTATGAVSLNGNATAAGTLAVQGSGGLTLGVAGTTGGILKLANTTNSNLSALVAAAPSGTGLATYSLPGIAGGSSDTVCLVSLGNCAGSGGGLIGSGTAGNIAKFNGSNSLTNSGLSESGTTLTYAGTINATGQYQVNGSQISSANLSNDSNLAKLNGSNNFSAANSFSAAGTALTVTNNASIGGTAAIGTLSVTNGGTIGGTLAVQGSSVSVGSTTQQGSLILNSGNGVSNKTATLQGIATLGQNTTYTLPDPGQATATICLSTGNCAGAGGGITGSGTSGKLAKFSGSGSIADSTLSEAGTTVTASGSVVIQGSGALTLGTASTNTGSIAFKNATNGNTLTLQSGVSGSSFSLTLPTTGGSNGDCLQSQGAGVLVFTSCTGGAGGGVTSLDSQTGVLSLANSSGSGGVITIDNASTTQKGIAQFNSTNFTAAAGVINTVQNIATTATPTFNGLTLSSALTVANGGTGASTLTANGILYGNGTSAVQATSAAANSILATNGSNVPSLTQTLPSAVQANITSTGALTAGSIASGFGTISTANNITTTSTVQGSTLNATSAIQLGGTNINTAGTLSNVAYLNQANSFSAANTFGSTVAVQGSGGITVGVAGTTAGKVNLANATNSNLSTLVAAAPSGTGTATYTLPTIAGGSGDTVCLVTLSNCSGANGGGGNTNYIFNQTTQQVGSNFNIDGTGKAAILNATSAIQLNGTNINTAGTLNNVAYLNQANTFSAANTFNAAGTALSVTNNASIAGTGTIGTLSVTNSATIGSGLTVTAGGLTVTAGASSFGGNVGITGTNTLTVGTGATSLGGTLAVTGTSTHTGLGTFNGGLTVATGNTFTNASSTLNTAVAITDKATGGNIGTAAATVDVATSFTVNQTTAGQTLTLPNPTTTTAGRIAYVANVGTASFTMHGVTIAAGQAQLYIWNGTAWTASNVDGAGSGVTTIGTIDTQTKSANGAVISGNSIYLQSADATNVGLVSTGTQTFAGAKTFNGVVTLAAAGTGLSVTNNASIGGTLGVTGATTLSNTLGVAGDFSINTNKFQVTASSGNTAIAGTLAVTGASTLTGLLTANGGITAVGNINTTGQFQVGGTQISSANLSNDSNLAKLNGANNFSAANTFSAAGTALTVTNNASIGGTATVGTLTVTNGGNFGGSLGVQGSSVTVGSTTQQGSLILNSGNGASNKTATLQGVATLGQNTTYTLPDPGVGTATICLSTGNCAGSGGGITGSGTSGKIAKFNGTGSIADSTLSESGSVVTASGSLAIQGAGALTLGTASANTGSIAFKNGSNANTVTLQAGASGSNFTLTLPTSQGSNGDCLKSDGTGALSFTACTGGSGGGVTSLDAQTGVLSLANSSGASGTITIDNASTTQKGIAQFNSTNFTAAAGVINTIQGIATTSAPTFNGLTLNSALTVTAGGASITGNVGVTGNINATGQYQVGGTQISSANLSNDGNLAKLNGSGPQTFTGNNKFTGTLLAQNATDSTTAFQVQNSSAVPVISVDTTNSRLTVRAGSNTNPALVIQDSTGVAALEVRASTIAGNSFIGLNAGLSNTTGYQNTTLGASALQNNTTGFQNVAIGTNALANNTTADSNTAVGFYALQATTTGTENTATGANALSSNNGSQNTAYGYVSLANNTTGNVNTSLGAYSLQFNTTGDGNNAFGYAALQNNTSGYNNNGYGAYALNSNTTGFENAAHGNQALHYNTTGAFNVAVGSYAGVTSVNANASTTGSRNTFLGYSSGPGVASATSLQNATAIGQASVVNANDTLTLGCISGVNGCTTTTKVGINSGGYANNPLTVSAGKYSTGTIAQTTTAITGTGTTFTSGMTGGTIYYSDGTSATVTYVSPTSLTSSLSKTVTAGSTYTIVYGGFNVTGTGTALLQNSTNSTTAFQIQNAAGTSNLLIADTLNGRLGIGLQPTTGGSVLQVAGGIQATQTSLTPATASLNGTLVYDSTAGKFKIYEGGAIKTLCNTTDLGCGASGASTTLQGAYDNATAGTPASIVTTSAAKTILFKAGVGFSSTTLFQVQAADASSVFDVNTTNKRVGIGTAAPAATLQVLGVDAVVGPVDATPVLQVTGGAGGASSCSGACSGGTGGGINLTAGKGGNSGDFVDTNGTGGSITLQAGAPGTGGPGGAYGAITLNASGGKVGVGTSAPGFKFDVQDAQATTYVAQIKNTNTTNTAKGLIIDLGVANASRGTGNYFIGFSGAGIVAGKIQGGASSVAYTTTAADYAEYFLTGNQTDKPQAGEIVMLDSSQGRAVLKSTTGNGLVGVVSTNPGFVGNGPLCATGDDNCDSDYARTNTLVGISGQIETKVSTLDGPLQPGDDIAASAIPGTGTKLTGRGEIVGKALEAFDPANGKGTAQACPAGTPAGVICGTIMVYVNPHYSDANNVQGANASFSSINNSGDANIGGNLTVAGTTTTGDLIVTNAATVQNLTVVNATRTKDLTVTGSAVVANLTVTGTAAFQGDITVGGHVITAGNAPAGQVMVAAGTNGVIAVDGNDTAGTITITTGAGSITAGDLAKISFSKTYGKAPRIVIAAQDDTSVDSKVHPGSKTANDFMLRTSQLLLPNTTYSFDYFIAQ